MEGELLPCPFCGGEARYEEVPSALGVAWSVGCCADETDCAGYQPMTSWATRRDAAAAWNRRSDRAGLIAGLRECAELADQWSEARLDEANAPIISGDVFTDGGVFVQSTADANAGYRLMDFAKSIRARIAALEEEGRGR